VVNISWYYAMLFQILTKRSLTRRLLSDQWFLTLAQNAYEGRSIPVANPLSIPKRKWIPKKIHGKADTRALTGAEIAAKELNAREREQRLRERERLAIDLTLDNGSDVPRIAMCQQLNR
jgi:hypothetical protein